MRFFQLLFKLVKTYLHYRKSVKQIRTSPGGHEMINSWESAFRSGDYETAGTFAPDLFLRASMLLQLGRDEEAEKLLRHVVEAEKQPQLAALVQSVLGEALLQQQRGKEAMQCFQAALQLWPER